MEKSIPGKMSISWSHEQWQYSRCLEMWSMIENGIYFFCLASIREEEKK